MAYKSILTETIKRVGIIRMNKAATRNSLDGTLYSELATAMETFDNSPDISAIILTGTDNVFSAGADIKYMSSLKYSDLLKQNVLANCDKLNKIRTPVVGIVNGYALGGGFELALGCDILLAGDNAFFGLPEVTVGTIPGGGGTQRLAKIIGKSRTMETILTNKKIPAQLALDWGILSAIHPNDKVFDAGLQIANKIASMSYPIVLCAKDAINNAFDTTLSNGLTYERRVFESTFAIDDNREGFTAFMEKGNRIGHINNF